MTVLLLTLLLSVPLLALCGSPRALVVWHGLGDSYNAPGMLEFMKLIEEIHPGIFIHSIYIDKDLDNDRKAGFYGNVNTQLDFVAEQLASVPELKDGFDAIGFSQGGQFLRAYVERFNSPSVNNLITFGSQHMGVSDIPPCRKYDFLCQMARRAAKGAVYSNWAQENIISAQYYRDPDNLETYLTSNHFLPYVNNEISDARNETYKRQLTSLNNLILILFADDKTVVPKESSWFGSEAAETDAWSAQLPFSLSKWLRGDKTIIPMRQQPLYTEDWLGLKELDERNAIIFETCKGEHMQISDCWKPIVKKYTGGSD